MPLERYRPEQFAEVERFARRLKWFDYVKHIIKWHAEEGLPGDCWVWRHRGRLVAFCGLRWLNRQDAWLYGMRVAKDVQNRGIARRFTGELFRVARDAGRTWAGINTYHYPGRPSPVYAIAARLGMKLEAVHAVDGFGDLPASVRGPRPRRMTGVQRHFTDLGEKVLFVNDRGWLWMRMLEQRRQQVDRGGFSVRGVPFHVARYKGGGIAVNLFDRPRDFGTVIPSILMRAVGRRRWVAVSYPAAWSREFRRAVRGSVRGLETGKNYWPSAWRIYGKYL